jgi:D-alanyl-D-alanine endopeptidase (penicillin-binding protein 7)
MNEQVTVVGTEGSSKIRRDATVTRQELIHLALISSDNLAARTLGETSGLSYENFITMMNDTALSLGMKDTHYADSTGLLAMNVSTPADIKVLVQETEKYPIFKQDAMKPNTTVDVSFKNKTRQVTATNTNQFAGKLDIISAKTGYTNPAGRCLTMGFYKNNMRYVIVVMGARSKEERYNITSRLIRLTD